MEPQKLSVTFAVFGNADQYRFLRMDGDIPEHVAAGFAIQGLGYCGFIALRDGTPQVQTEPGKGGVMALAGLTFAEHLGVYLKEVQLAALDAAKVRY